MQIQFIGTGGAFDYPYGNSAAWIRLNGDHILLDCGCTVYNKLRANGLAEKIDYILISHMHDDHVGSLSTTILHHKHCLAPPRKAKLLYVDSENGRILRDKITAYLSFSLLNPEDYFDFLPLAAVPGIVAIDTTDKHVLGMESFGFMFEDQQQRIVYSGDLGDPDLIADFVTGLDSSKKLIIFHDTFFLPNKGVHAHYRDLMERLEGYEVYAYHLDPAFEPEDNQIPLVVRYPEWML